MDTTLLNVNEVAAFLGVHPKTIYRYRRENGFPKGVKKVGSRRWLHSEILAWMGLAEEKVAISSDK